MDNITNKINALFAKAESTDSTHEAEALLAKAQELMIKHAIDAELLGERKDSREEVAFEDVELATKGSPGAQALFMLLCATARANSVTPLGTNEGWHDARLIGYPRDITSAKAMYHAIVLAMFDAELKSRANRPRHEHARTWKVSFYNGFVHTMSTKLLQARDDAVSQANAEHGSSAELVLVSKEQRVQTWISENMTLGRATRSASRTRSASGFLSGVTAANTVDLRSRGSVESR